MRNTSKRRSFYLYYLSMDRKTSEKISRVLVTGAAGYIGGMIIDRLLELYPGISIVGVDLLPEPEKSWPADRVFWIRADLAGNGWQKKALEHGPFDAVIHCAFRIRTPFGKVHAYERNNRGASRNTFLFAFDNKVPSLVYLSTVASYGARPENIGHLITEDHPFFEMKNPYGLHKRLIEEDLRSIMSEKNPSTRVTVLRLNSVTGPHSQGLSSKFGLITFLKKLLPFVMELNPHWARQFVHEDDVVDAILTSLGSVRESFLSVYNIAPERFLEVRDIAGILNKRIIKLPPFVMKAALFVLWPVSFGKLVPMSAADGLTYPINVNGSAITKDLNFNYRYTAEEALKGEVGRYSKKNG